MVSYHLLAQTLSPHSEFPASRLAHAISSAIRGLIPHETYVELACEAQTHRPADEVLSSRVAQLLQSDCNPLLDLVRGCDTEHQFVQRWNAINTRLKLGVSTFVSSENAHASRTSHKGTDHNLRCHVMTLFLHHLRSVRRSRRIPSRHELFDIATEMGSACHVHADLIAYLYERPAASLPMCVAALGGSRRTFQRYLGIAGVSFLDIRQAVRISLGKNMLRETMHTMTEVALCAGFYDAAHFCHAFRQSCGLSPSEYRVLALAN